MSETEFWGSFRLYSGVALMFGGAYLYQIMERELFGVLCMLLGLIWIVQETQS